MFVIIGWFVALGFIFGIFIAHGGNMEPILHALPWEMGQIGGATLGAFLVNNQMPLIKSTIAGALSCFKGSKYTKARYMELLALMFDILQKARKEGLMSIEKDVEDPHSSAIFQKYPLVGNDHHVCEFITDYLRMMVSGNLNAHEIESLMDSEIETHHHEAHGPVAAIQRVAGGLPAFGIVAAVLGVVKTMGSIDKPPSWWAPSWAFCWPTPLPSRWAACWNRRLKKPARNCSASRPRCWPACRATPRKSPSSSAARCSYPQCARRSANSKPT